MTEKEKGMVEAYKINKVGKFSRWIWNKLGRHESSIRYYCNNIGWKKKKRGPKQKLSDGTKRLIIRKTSNKATPFEHKEQRPHWATDKMVWDDQ